MTSIDLSICHSTACNWSGTAAQGARVVKLGRLLLLITIVTRGRVKLRQVSQPHMLGSCLGLRDTE